MFGFFLNSSRKSEPAFMCCPTDEENQMVLLLVTYQLKGHKMCTTERAVRVCHFTCVIKLFNDINTSILQHYLVSKK